MLRSFKMVCLMVSVSMLCSPKPIAFRRAQRDRVFSPWLVCLRLRSLSLSPDRVWCPSTAIPRLEQKSRPRTRGVSARVPTRVSVLSWLLHTLNQTCWLRAFLGGVYLKVWTRAAMPHHDWRAKLTFEENTEILVAPIESHSLWATGGYVCRVPSGRSKLTLRRFVLDAIDTFVRVGGPCPSVTSPTTSGSTTPSWRQLPGPPREEFICRYLGATGSEEFEQSR